MFFVVVSVTFECYGGIGEYRGDKVGGFGEFSLFSVFRVAFGVGFLYFFVLFFVF